MSENSRRSPEQSREKNLEIVKSKIDRIAKEIVRTWGEDKGWATTLLEEIDAGDSKYALKELGQEQKTAREKFYNLKNALEELLNQYHAAVQGTEVETEFPYAAISSEDKKVYIKYFRKMFEQQGIEIK
ncbi:MAG: hypothetical protein WC725_05575 [Patescibacteria group bacterium]|jgi:hypothetical protein